MAGCWCVTLAAARAWCPLATSSWMRCTSRQVEESLKPLKAAIWLGVRIGAIFFRLPAAETDVPLLVHAFTASSPLPCPCLQNLQSAAAAEAAAAAAEYQRKAAGEIALQLSFPFCQPRQRSCWLDGTSLTRAASVRCPATPCQPPPPCHLCVCAGTPTRAHRRGASVDFQQSKEDLLDNIFSSYTGKCGGSCWFVCQARDLAAAQTQQGLLQSVGSPAADCLSSCPGLPLCSQPHALHA